MGDTADNIPGVPGIGEKKAKQLVAEFGSIENMIENSDKIANEKLRNLVKEYADQALFSKELIYQVRLHLLLQFFYFFQPEN